MRPGFHEAGPFCVPPFLARMLFRWSRALPRRAAPQLGLLETRAAERAV